MKQVRIQLREYVTRVRESIKRGWTQGVLFRDIKGIPCNQDTAHSCCLVGAMSLNKTNQHQFPELAKLLEKKIKTKCKLFPLVEWNNHPKRTKKDVLSLIDSVAKELP